MCRRNSSIVNKLFSEPTKALKRAAEEEDTAVGERLRRRLCDFSDAVRLWQAGVKCQPGDVNTLMELSQALMLAGNKAEAYQYLAEVQKLDPQNQAALALLMQVNIQ